MSYRESYATKLFTFVLHLISGGDLAPSLGGRKTFRRKKILYIYNVCFVVEQYQFQNTAVNNVNIYVLYIEPLYCGSGLTIWQAGIQHHSTFVLITRQDGGYRLL